MQTWNENSIDSQPAPAEPGQEASLQFLRSLRPQPGCEKDGVCNECGLCEH